MNEVFTKLTRQVAWYSGRAPVFIAAVAVVLIWLVTGPYFEWSDRHSLAINTFTTIVTFLMMFIVQNTQTRDTAELKAMLREMTEDISEVDEVKARERVTDEERP